MTQTAEQKKTEAQPVKDPAAREQALKAFEEVVQKATKDIVIPNGNLDLMVVGDVLAVLKRVHNRIVEFAQKHMDSLKV